MPNTTTPAPLPPRTSARFTGRVLLTPDEAATNRREYLCTFIAAGRVKQADQELSSWVLPAETLLAAVGLFDGRPSYLDHPELYGFAGVQFTPLHQEPKVEHLIGVTFAPEWDEDQRAIIGGLRLYDRAPGSPGWLVGALFDQILDDTANGLCVPPIGLSAVFYHTSHLDEDSGLRVTDNIHYVESVDLVYDPGAAGYIRQALSCAPHRRALRPYTVSVAGDLLSPGGNTMPQEHDIKTPESSAPTASPLPPAGGATSPSKGTGRGSAHAQTSAPSGSVGAQHVAFSAAVGAQHLAHSAAVGAQPPHSDGRAPSVPLSQNPPETPGDGATLDVETLLQRISAMETAVTRLTQSLATVAEANTVRGMEPVSPKGGAVHGMRSSLDQVQAAIEAMLSGTRPPDGIQPLTGIRELYTLLSGDYEMTGRFNADRVYLANVTSSTMAGLVANALNKRVMNLYQTYPKWWEPAVTEEDFASLQDARWITLGGIGELPTVAEGAAYTEMTWDDNTETASFVKKGGYLGLTIEAIDKDDTRRLQAAPRALAQAAWMTLGKTIAALFTANSGYGATLADATSLFDAGRGNLGSTAFSHAAWLATKVAMMKFTELNSGERMAALTKPHLVWVPVDLEDAAIAELAAGEGQVGSANYDINPDAFDDSLTARISRARSRVIACPFFTDATDWMAQADPRLYPGLGLGYRYGRTPEIFSVASPTAGLMFTNDTMPVKVRFFFATGITDWRAWYKHIVTG